MKNFEKFDWQSLKPQPVIGVDEVGRGCLAGPVYAAAVIINPSKQFEHYTDSKKLSAKRREIFSQQIHSDHKLSIGFATTEEISKLNILHASLLAMKRAVLGLKQNFGHILVDGNFKISGLDNFHQTTLIKGDLRAHPVAAASIVAKVARDQLLTEFSIKYPGYGFEKHKGYSTQLHKEAIEKKGPCEIHRPEFAGVREHLSNRSVF